jgi:MinD-like ATPase involved in chromosome partitioning or flagellar assembly
MENISVGLLHVNRAYAEALIRAAAESYRGFRFSVLDDLDMGSTPADSVKPDALCDVYLIGVDLLERELPPEISDRSVVLYDACSEYPPKGRSAVDMYGSCREIVSFVLAKYAESTGRPLPQIRSFGAGADGTPQIISFLSLEGGAGTSSVAIAAARELSRFRDRKTMYVSLETYASPAYWEPTDRTCMRDEDIPNCIQERAVPQLDLNGYVYCFLRKQDEALIRHRAAAMLYDAYGVAHFRTAGGLNILPEFSAEELRTFIESLSRDSDLDYIVLDWGVRLDSVVRDFLCDASAAVIVNAADSDKRRYTVKTQADICAALGLDRQQLIFVTNKAGEDAEGYLTFNCFEGEPDPADGFSHIVIPYDTDSFRRGKSGVRIELTNAFGMGIKNLADEILGVRAHAETADRERWTA